jgi:hypothetical protein
VGRIQVKNSPFIMTGYVVACLADGPADRGCSSNDDGDVQADGPALTVRGTMDSLLIIDRPPQGAYLPCLPDASFCQRHYELSRRLVLTG